MGVSGSAAPLELAVDNLEVQRGGRAVLSGLSFKLKAGEAMLLTGPNGAGKTTLLRTLASFIAPSQGTASLAGGRQDRTMSEQSHYVGHLNGLRSHLTVAENAAFWARYLGSSAAQAELALRRFGLDALGDVPTAYLSAGQRRRLGLARLLLADRPVWLLDEPTTSLDTASAGVVSQIIDEHTAGGGIAIIATHADIHVARAVEFKLGGTATA